MLSRAILIATLLTTLAGCKMSGGNATLAARTASTALNDAYFSGPAAVQTATFSEGKAQPQKPLALDTFLYAKRWLECKNTEPGPFSSDTICRFDTAGKTYAHENGWTSAPSPGGCPDCETWTVPLAHAHLSDITDISRVDKTHATATYTYTVTPNEFGGEFGAWMADHMPAWCGPDPRAIGGWSQTRTGRAAFVQDGSTWHLVTPATTFADDFAQSGDKAPDRPCPQT